MDIQDLLTDNEVDNSPEEESAEELNLDDVEKTAELLEVHSKEDVLVDDIAKIAVLQDYLDDSGVFSQEQKTTDEEA